MHIDAGEALRRGWEQGKVICKHPELVEEHDSENRLTGKQFCKVCGEYQTTLPCSKDAKQDAA